MLDGCLPNSTFAVTIFNASFISTPEFPGSYPNDSSCTWKIIGAGNKSIQLNVDSNPNYEIEEK